MKLCSHAMFHAVILFFIAGCRSSEKESSFKEPSPPDLEVPHEESEESDPLDRDTSSIIRNDCEKQEGFIWVENQCVLRVEYECKQKGWILEGKTCLNPPESECRKRSEWLWKDGNCVLKAEVDCLQQTEKEWTGSVCVTKEEAECTRRPEMVWEQGTCQLAIKVSCLRDKNVWKDDRCIDKNIAACEGRTEKHVWVKETCVPQQQYECELDQDMVWHDNRCVAFVQAQCEKDKKVWIDAECISKADLERRESDAQQKSICLGLPDIFEGEKVFVWSSVEKKCLPNPSIKECQSQYTVTELLSEAKDSYRKVWQIEGNKVAKEILWSQEQFEIVKKQLNFYSRASEAEVSPNILSHGLCRRDTLPLLFITLPKLELVSVDNADSKSFKESAKHLIQDLHEKARIVHGDIHIGNFLYSPDEEKYFVYDLDNSIDLDEVPEHRRAGFLGFEDYRLELLTRGNFAPPDVDIPGYPDSWRERGYEPWHMNIYKYVYFDTNMDGRISEKEVDKLSDAIGIYENALVIKDLYDWRMKDLSEDVRKGFLKDVKKDGSGDSSYMKFVKKLKDNWRHPVAEGSRRIVLDTHRYAKMPLEADHILVISGGDFHQKRMFPFLAHHLYQKFAEARGYRNSYFTENLAAIDRENGGENRVPYWSKIYMILDLLEQPKNRVIVWLDDDGILADRGEPSMVERYLTAYPDQDLIIAWDPEEFALVNSGAMIVRNTDAMRTFFRDVLSIGEEERCWIECDKIGNCVQTEGTLMTCKQSRNCLHEQQAIQELYLPMRRSCNNAVNEWHKASDSSRVTATHWKTHIALVPQWDDNRSLNMNIFVSGKGGTICYGGFGPYTCPQGYIRFRKSTYKNAGPDGVRPFLVNEPPFFMQCAGITNKHNCIAEVLSYLNILPIEEMKNIVTQGMEKAGLNVTEDQINSAFEFPR